MARCRWRPMPERSLPMGRWAMCRVIAGSAACPTMAGISAAGRSSPLCRVWLRRSRPRWKRRCRLWRGRPSTSAVPDVPMPGCMRWNRSSSSPPRRNGRPMPGCAAPMPICRIRWRCAGPCRWRRMPISTPVSRPGNAPTGMCSSTAPWRRRCGRGAPAGRIGRWTWRGCRLQPDRCWARMISAAFGPRNARRPRRCAR